MAGRIERQGDTITIHPRDGLHSGPVSYLFFIAAVTNKYIVNFTATVILCHGLGDSADGFSDVGGM